MSGRKSSEVAAVLRQGEQVRALTDNIYRRQIEDLLNNAERSSVEINSVKKAATALKASLTDDALEMFSEDGPAYLKQFSVMKEKLSFTGIDLSVGERIKEELKRIDEKTREADREGEAIRQSIRRKSHYCDDEYRRAEQLLTRYNDIRARRVQISRDAEKFAREAASALNAAKAHAEQIKGLYGQFRDMNETARKRRQSDEMRSQLKKTLGDIEKGFAEKFFADEYATLQKNVEKLIPLNDDAFMEKFRKAYGDVTTFAVKLAERTTLWRSQKADAESQLASLESAAAFSMIGPVEYTINGENGEHTGFLDYLAEYGGEDIRPKYAEMLKNVKELMDTDDFTVAVSRIGEAREFIAEARKTALELQEKMLGSTELARSIQDIMEDMRYDTELEIIGDNPKNGYRLTCSVGGETINFDKIIIGDDGKPTIEIDHRERAGGNCANSWRDIMGRFQDNGIPITDVKKNGRSVIYTDTRMKQGNTQSQRTH